MSVYDPGQQPVPPTTNLGGYTTVPSDAQPATSADRWGLIAVTVAVMTVLSCVPGLNCIAPLAPLVAGIIALSQAGRAADPDRARTYGWIATGLGIIILLAGVALIAVYGAFFASMMQQIQNNPEFRTSP